MKSVLISIKPKWCELIANGKKTIEVRKTRPKCDTPFKCYIYCTKGKSLFWTSDPFDICLDICLNGKVIGEFVCDAIYDCRDVNRDDTCITVAEWLKYTKGHKGKVYGWHISDLVIYDKPKELSEFGKPVICHRGIQKDNCNGCWDCEIKRPPQSWCYCEEIEE